MFFGIDYISGSYSNTKQKNIYKWTYKIFLSGGFALLGPGVGIRRLKNIIITCMKIICESDRVTDWHSNVYVEKLLTYKNFL